jgi:hypothetical protein
VQKCIGSWRSFSKTLEHSIASLSEKPLLPKETKQQQIQKLRFLLPCYYYSQPGDTKKETLWLTQKMWRAATGGVKKEEEDRGCTQGCQIFLGPSIPNWEKYNK